MKPEKLKLNNHQHAIIVVLLAAFAVSGGCASLGNPDDAESIDDPMKVAEKQCRPGMKLECYERSGQPTRCTCITTEELEKVLTDFIH
jgi:hypothetical protein